ncbi:MAG: hypothetical protein M3Y30_14975, partial [Gemmatimonadota bacterium]|nr:hypothetical protein [Gemmatimonadota bacterium]
MSLVADSYRQRGHRSPAELADDEILAALRDEGGWTPSPTRGAGFESRTRDSMFGRITPNDSTSRQQTTLPAER